MADLLRALYTHDIPGDAWTTNVTEELRPFMDRYGLGVIGVSYECPDPCSLRITHSVGVEVSDDLLELLVAGGSQPPPSYVAERFLTHSYSLGADLSGWDSIGPVKDRSAAALGVVDLLAVVTTELDGTGCGFFSFQSARAPLSAQASVSLSRIARHLTAAHRLRCLPEPARRSVAGADAVLDPSGHVHHACGDAKALAARMVLSRAARSLDRASTRKGRSDPQESLDGWPRLIAGRWSLIERFERDGQRYILAVENRRSCPGFASLSPRERQVLNCAIEGHHPKAIAYELAIAYSTVRVLMGRVMTKLGVSSWRNAIDHAKRAQQ